MRLVSQNLARSTLQTFFVYSNMSVMIATKILVSLVILWGALVLIDRRICGPTISTHKDVERFIREGKLQLNSYNEKIMTYSSLKHDPNFRFISHFNPLASWIPGVMEYRIAQDGAENSGWRVQDGSELHRKIKEKHERLISEK